MAGGLVRNVGRRAKCGNVIRLEKVNIKNIYRAILFISFFFLFGFAIVYLGDYFPKWKWYSTWTGWILMLILYGVVEILGEIFFNKHHEKMKLIFWNRFSERDLKVINMLLLGFILLLVLSIPILYFIYE